MGLIVQEILLWEAGGVWKFKNAHAFAKVQKKVIEI